MSGFGRIKRAAGHFLLAVAGLSCLAACLAGFEFWVFLRTPGDGGMEVREVEIPSGTGTAGIAKILEERGVISDARMFRLLCFYSRYRGGSALQAGDYAFPPFSLPEQVLDRIVHGRVVTFRITFPEGSTVRDVARLLEQQRLAREEDVLKLAGDGDFSRSIGLDAPQLEGYLYPDTYLFKKKQGGPAILKAMVQQFRNHLPAGWEARTRELGLTLHQAVILASIVEKEAVVDSERPVIAAVFLNRLRGNMPLQSDPTAVYDLPDFSGPVTPAHLKRQSPYNTYQNRGLPVGPICNPGSKSLRAALHPEKVRYLYFVSNNDGTHYFSETLADHNQAVSRIIGKRKAQQGESRPPAQPEP